MTPRCRWGDARERDVVDQRCAHQACISDHFAFSKRWSAPVFRNEAPMTVKSSAGVGVLHDAVEVAGEVALEDAGGVAAALAFGDAAGDVVACCGVVLAAVEHDRCAGRG